MRGRTQRRRLRRTAKGLAMMAAWLLVGGACSSDDDQSSAPSTDTIAQGSSSVDGTDTTVSPGGYDLRTSGIPRVEEGGCPPRVQPSDRVQCLTLVVPESRNVAAADSGRLVRLPVVIVAAIDPAERAADPVLWVDYGAGDGFVVGRALIFINETQPLNENRDVITLDVRGSGFAEPSLACPEVTELGTGVLLGDIDETSAEGRAIRLDAIEQCHDRLVADGVDLSAYGADAAAQDLDDLRLALGVEQWNIVAGEYGSKLAQILARDHPESVRSVVVNATPVPLQADWFADLAPNAARGWSTLVSTCEGDAGCAQAFPDLAARFDAYVADLATSPRHHTDVELAWGEHAPFLMTATRLLAYVRFYGRDNQYLADVPISIAGPPGRAGYVLKPFDPDDPVTLIYQASDASASAAWGVWELFPHNTDTDSGSYALGAHLSSMCRDEAPFTDTAALAAAAAVPPFGPFLGRHHDLEACAVWGVEPSSAAANQAVHSDVPFLVLAGDLDTVSSPAWADAFADGLSRAQIVHFPGSGTQPTSGLVSSARTCALQLRQDFLAAPSTPIDDTCVATSHGPAFFLP